MTKRRHYKVDTLKCREQIREWLSKGVPYREIVKMIEELGEEISHSSLCRYHKNWRQITERLTKAKEMVKGLIDALKERPNTDLSETASQLLLQAAIERIAEAEEGLEGESLLKIGRMVAELEKSAVFRERTKLLFSKEHEKKVKNVVMNIEKKTKGKLDPKTLKVIREEIYGIIDKPSS